MICMSFVVWFVYDLSKKQLISYDDQKKNQDPRARFLRVCLPYRMKPVLLRKETKIYLIYVKFAVWLPYDVRKKG